MPGTTLRARLLGGFDLLVDGRRVDHAAFERPSGLRLLKLLLATPGHRLRREDAAERLWPEADPDRSSANLRKAIHFARSALRNVGGEGALAIEGEQVGLDPAASIDVDADRLTAVLDQLERQATGAGELETLAQLGGEELLPDDPYEEWVVPFRERLRERSRAGLLRGAGLARASGQPQLAFRLLDRALGLDPADEDAHRVAIELHLEAGALHAARRQLQLATHAIEAAYGVRPSESLVALVSEAATVAHAQPASAGPAATPPIIGRRREVEAVEALLDEAAAGRLQAVVLRGPAGIGKTRILQEIERELRAGDWLRLEARGLESGSTVPFGAVGRALADAVGHRVPEDWADPARSALLAIGVGVEGDQSMVFASDDALGAGVLAAIERLVASSGSTAIVVDDVQWLDAQSVAAIAAAVGTLRALPVIVVATMRDLETTPAHVLRLLEDVRRADGQEIAVQPLAPREIQLLVERDAGSAAKLDAPLARWLHERSAGVPLFALELFRGLREQGGAESRDGRWTLTSRASDVLPRSVSLLVGERTARLGKRTRELLATAAEAGDEVDFSVLVSATEAPADDVLDALDQGLAAGLLTETSDGYRFAHPLFRAMLRKSIPARSRPAIHHRIARTMAAGIDPANRRAVEAAASNGMDIGAIADHAATAAELGVVEALDLAVGFGAAAGTRQGDLFDFEGAATTLQRAIALWYRLPEPARGRFPASQALVALGWALQGLGDGAGAITAFDSAATVAATDEQRAAAWVAAAWLAYQRGAFTRADELLRRGLSTVTDPVARATLEVDRAWIVGRLGGWRKARTILEQWVPMLENGDPDVLARSLDRLAVTVRDTGEPGRAVPIFERSLAMARIRHNTRMEATAYQHLAGALRLLDRLEDARTMAGRAIELSRLSGDRYMESVSEWIAGEVDHAAGDYASAGRRRQRELEILSQIGGNPQNEAMAHAHLANLARIAGDDEAFNREAEAARAAASHSGVPQLARRIEAALTTQDWFDAGAHTEAGTEEAS